MHAGQDAQAPDAVGAHASAEAGVEGGPADAGLARSDLKDAVGWTLLGLATLVGSLRMDRLESQDINPYTVPGLLPGLLGIALVLLGLLMGVRSLRRGALGTPPPRPADPWGGLLRRRVVIALALCIGYAVLMVGRGLPFWLASSVFILVSILTFRRLSLDPQERRIDLRVGVNALLISVGVSVTIWLVFERVFLVRLP